MLTDVQLVAREAVETAVSSGRATVSVVITTFNDTRFLADAISSVLGQTRVADEIIVVDDGSADDPAAVVANFAQVRMVRRENGGLSAARNTGLRNCTTSHVLFLDADDRLLPTALEAGLGHFSKCFECAFVYGGHRVVSEDGWSREGDYYIPITGGPHLALLRGNLIGMHATVLYRRDRLMEVGGFDEALRRCEDYDVYLRLAQRYQISSYPTIVAEYRKHGQNMSTDLAAMLRTVLAVLDGHERRIIVGAPERAALRYGRANWRHYYVWLMLRIVNVRWREHRAIAPLTMGVIRATLWSPRTVVRAADHLLRDHMKKVLPPRWVRWIQRLRGRADRFPLGSVRFGDLRRLTPISRTFGFDRGTPVDRYYVESFLAENASDIRGRVLEIGDNSYTLRFGGSRVERSDILHVDTTNPRATFVGDLAGPNELPAAVFDCIVLTQTLHLLFDMRAGIRTLYRALKPGGVLLLTTPGISQIDSGEWGATWYWSLTASAARRLLEERFRPEAVVVKAHGNVFAATAFLYGLAVEELDRTDLDFADASYPVIVAARVIKEEV
jgi:glycosyltransferase involved in cell wall biosynthesis